MSWRVALDLRLGALHLEVDISGDARPTAIVGPNGSGKTTLLRTIAGMHSAQRGMIVVDDYPLFDAARGIDRAPERRRVGYLPQGHRLFPHLSVIDNVTFGLGERERAVSRAQQRVAAALLLDELGCGQLARRFPRELSGGEQQRVALARALIVEPRLLLLDEPLAALDAGARRTTRAFLATHLRERGVPAIVVTHDPRDVLALDADICVLEVGKVVQRGTVEELRVRPATDFVGELFADSLVAAAMPTSAT